MQGVRLPNLAPSDDRRGTQGAGLDENRIENGGQGDLLASFLASNSETGLRQS